MRHFVVKGTLPTLNIECSYNISAESKEDAETEFKNLMPSYVINKVKEKRVESPNGESQ